MLFLPTSLIKPGMTLAKSVFIGNSSIPLITEGQVLTEQSIEKIANVNLSGVYIDTNICFDVEVVEVLDEKLKNETLSSVRIVFEDFNKNLEVSTTNIKNISNLASNLVINILSNDAILVNIIELKGHDDYTYCHSLYVAILSIYTAYKLGFTTDMLIELCTSALLHDIGKVKIPLSILNKPNSLTEDEFEIMKTHPEHAYFELKQRNVLSNRILEAIKCHHEKYDGTGYPNGLAKDQIPLYSRILAVADVYNALTSTRPYRDACFPSEAIEYIMACNGVHFDPIIVDAFLKVIAVYPVGTLVALSNNKIAVVVHNYPENSLRPVVRIINEDGTSAYEIDLLYDSRYYNLTIVGTGYDSEIIAKAINSNMKLLNI